MPGGYGGIGEAICWGLAMAGASVAIAGRDFAKAERLAAELRRAGYKSLGIRMDAAKVVDIRRAVGMVVRCFGRLDILVNCVGIQDRKSVV